MSRAPAKPEVPPLSEASASIAGLAFPWFGELGIVGWHGCIWQPVKVVGETPKRYRIEATEKTKLAGRCRWIEVGQTALVPKGAIRKAEIS
jgi:hypothetical protein